LRIKKHKYDKIFLYTVFSLLLFGIIVLSSASIAISQENFGESYYYLKHQLFNGVLVGLLLFYIGLKVDYRWWKKLSLPLLIVGILLLVLVLGDSFGYGNDGVQRWLKFGNITFQPAELIKLFFIFYLAALLEKKKKGIRDFYKGFMPFIIVLGIISLLIIAQPDIGTLGVIIMISVAIYFMAGANLYHLMWMGISGLIALFVLVKTASYRMDRFKVFLKPGLEPQGIGYQINQALIAIGSGGIWGLGFGLSRQKLLYLPETIGDSIFAIISEELGFIGASFLVFMFLVLAVRGFRVSIKAPDKFAELTVFGIVFWIVFQAFVNMAAISGLLPLTGIPLPFISYGGTSLALTLFGMGVVLNISKYTINN
jgi:cell division protein FtsW